MEVVERDYHPRAFSTDDLTGQTFGSLYCIERRGFIYGNKYAAYQFRCECGNEVVRCGAHVKHAAKSGESRYARYLHCGCKSRYRRHGESTTSRYHLWNGLKNKGRLCERWSESYVAYRDECLAMKDGKFLCRFDRTQPASLDNFFWADISDACFAQIDRVAEILMESRGLSFDDAYTRAAGISRQRRKQLVLQAEGRCSFCGCRRERLSHQCNACAKKQSDHQKLMRLLE